MQAEALSKFLEFLARVRSLSSQAITRKHRLHHKGRGCVFAAPVPAMTRSGSLLVPGAAHRTPLQVAKERHTLNARS